ncbi:MAG: DUF4037 domain-containing protein [Lachnospiraceae bacterium]|nr:DUF4037 domain-containing protein [Lachnospiraceae bacterium]
MDINKVLNEYDAMYGKVSLEAIEDFLFEKIKEAMSEEDTASLITLLNEMIGLCRDTTQKEKALTFCNELRKLLERLELQNTQSYATSMLNIANAYRAFGLYEDALNAFTGVESCYNRCLDSDDFLFASLYNNWGLLYQEIGDYAKAKETLLLALRIVDKRKGAEMPKASTLANLGAAMILLPDKENKDEAVKYIKEALELFEADGGKDFHYSAALAAMGDAYYGEKDYINASAYYQKALLELYKHVGRNKNYERVYEKYQNALKAAGDKGVWISNIERSREFYEKYGKKMIHEQFTDYEERIAVGFVGEGSDCFGFDDAVSMDHDYAPGFCMWLIDEDYVAIGESLQKAYDELIRQHGIGNMTGNFLERRRGVSSVSAFYNRLLGQDISYEKPYTIDYTQVQEYQLAQAVNGEVFRDNLGVFTGIREYLSAYYPEKIWRVKLAQCLHDFSQYAQSNYPRMMTRKDYVTASICIGKAIESIMDIIYLLNRRYAPYYKWKNKGLKKLDKLQEAILILEQLAVLPCQKDAWETCVYTSETVNNNDEAVVLLEKAAEHILREMNGQGIVDGSETFLEFYTSQVLTGAV